MLNKSIRIGIVILFFSINALGQSYSITGSLIDENKNPVLFANIGLHEQTDSLLITGDMSGKFLIDADHDSNENSLDGDY